MNTVRPRSSIMTLLFLILSPALFWPAYADSTNANITIEDGTYKVTSWKWRVERVERNSGRAGEEVSFGHLTIETPSNDVTSYLLDRVASGLIIPQITLVDGNLSIIADSVVVAGLSLMKPGQHEVRFELSKYSYITNSGTVCFDIPANAYC